jgi:hypothetical protein
MRGQGFTPANVQRPKAKKAGGLKKMLYKKHNQLLNQVNMYKKNYTNSPLLLTK